MKLVCGSFDFLQRRGACSSPAVIISFPSMSDSSSMRSSVRASMLLGRPQTTPMGPRTRQSTIRVSTVSEDAGPSSSTVAEASAPAMSPTFSPSSLPVSRSNSMSPKPLPSTPSPIQPKPLPSPIARTPSLPLLSGGPQLPSFTSIASPLLDEEFSGRNSAGGRTGSPLARSPSAGPSTPQTPLPSFSERHKMSSESEDDEETVPAYTYTQERDSVPQFPPMVLESISAPAKVSPIYQAHPKFVPPPAIKFETSTVPWKSMPLEAALWTFNSKELQEIVSRAIRSSSQESFIRLLTIDNLDNVLPNELERLEAERATTQARYRFLVHRRTMLFQALNSSSTAQARPEDAGSVSVVNKLTAQLAETITDCDLRLEELLKTNDQIAQVNKLMDIHSASALAIALRKLNGSYARRTKDLNTARDRIFQLESELDDAWKEAEKVAAELDDYETALSADDTEAVIETAEIVPVPLSPPGSPPPSVIPLKRRGSIPMKPTLMEVRTLSSPSSPTSRTVLLPQSGSGSPAAPTQFVFPPVALRQQSEDHDNSDAVSVRSFKSNKSSKSTQGAKVLRTSSVQAAKKRSFRASQGSLRINPAASHGRKHSTGSGRKTPFVEDAPPIPDLPLHFVNPAASAGVQLLKGGMSQEFGYHGPPSANASSTLLHFDGIHGRQGSASTTGTASTSGSRLRPQEVAIPSTGITISQPLPSPVPTLRRQASLDTVCTVGKTTIAAIDAYRGKPVDDIYLRTGGTGSRTPRSTAPFSPIGPYSSTNIPTNIPWDDEEIQIIPRTPPYRSQTFNGRSSIDNPALPPRPPPKDPAKTIPSMWMNVDAVKATPTARSASSPMAASTSHSSNSGSSPVSMAASIPLSNISGASATASAVSETSSGLSRRSTTYDRLKGLTKRYSTSIPLFNVKVPKTGMKRVDEGRIGTSSG
ncbi:hypothetical protein CPB83DRAFT_850790 [Crepidotus variabilis]|uniref:Uncharacterized protein n=1 Tax=Crepidotus variabilis TaxID=179855 RepID=A0A9P6EK21_9AGAR|nr:hypothetical protein CPB83DRAFT_850790 [Crepidotus variabilis]